MTKIIYQLPIITLKNIKTTIKKKLNNKGFSLAEMLVCVLILLLVSAAMTQGIAFAIGQYQDSMELSQSTVLCSTLKNKISSELRYLSYEDVDYVDPAKDIYPAFRMCKLNDDGTVEETPMDSPDAYGVVQLGRIDSAGKFSGNFLLPTAAYTYNMVANVAIMSFPQEDDKRFIIRIIVNNAKGELLTQNEFTVTLIN